MSAAPLVVVASLLIALGGGLLVVGARALREQPPSRRHEATVVAHTPVEVEMVTGARGARRTVPLVEVRLTLDDGGTSREVTLRRAPELAARDFAIGTRHALFVDDAGRAETTPEDNTLALVELAGGLALVLVGALLFFLRRGSA